MYFTKQTALAILAFASTIATAAAAAVPLTKRDGCSTEQRLATAQLFPDSYNHAHGASLDHIHFAADCFLTVYPNGGDPIELAHDGASTRDFVTKTQDYVQHVDVHVENINDYSASVDGDLKVGMGLFSLTRHVDMELVFNGACEVQGLSMYADLPAAVLKHLGH